MGGRALITEPSPQRNSRTLVGPESWLPSTSPDELALVGRPNSLGHGHKPRGRGGKGSWQHCDCCRHAQTLQTWGSGAVSVSVALRSSPAELEDTTVPYPLAEFSSLQIQHHCSQEGWHCWLQASWGSIWAQEVRLFSQVILKHSNAALFIFFFFFFFWRKQNILNLFFPDTIGMFGCEPCCSKPYSPMLCGKPSACKHRLGTGSPHYGHMAARIYHRLETVQSCRQRGFANQSPAWLKDVTHWPFLQPWEWCSSLKWLPRAAAAARVREGSLPALSLCTKHLFHMCFSERRIYLWFNRAFRYRFQIATVASFSYAGFKLKDNEN